MKRARTSEAPAPGGSVAAGGSDAGCDGNRARFIVEAQRAIDARVADAERRWSEWYFSTPKPGEPTVTLGQMLAYWLDRPETFRGTPGTP